MWQQHQNKRIQKYYSIAGLIASETNSWPQVFTTATTRSTKDTTQIKSPKYNTKWDHIDDTYVACATAKLKAFSANHNIPVFFKPGNRTETTAGPPRGTHTKTQTICAVKWSEEGTACTLEKNKPPFFEHNQRANPSGQESAVYTH